LLVVGKLLGVLVHVGIESQVLIFVAEDLHAKAVAEDCGQDNPDHEASVRGSYISHIREALLACSFKKLLTANLSELVARESEDPHHVEGAPAACSVPQASGHGVGALSVPCHSLCLDELIVLENHFFPYFIIFWYSGIMFNSLLIYD
jgi:hypothetical protein